MTNHFETYFDANSNTPRLYSQWLNSLINWLINHCTDWRDIIQSPVDFMTSSIIYRIVTLTKDGVKVSNGAKIFTTT